MATKRTNPNRIKLHRSYSPGELAGLLNVHKNTVRQWQRDGLQPIDNRRPILFTGDTARAFLIARNASRKHPCPTGTIYCFRCREGRPPAGAMADYVPVNSVSGNLRAICATCETIMHRRIRLVALPAAMPGIDVQIMEGERRLVGTPCPSLNSDFGTERLA